MEYRFLGKTGVQVSALSLGSWVTFHTQVGNEAAVDCMAAAYDAGVNFFDNAEVYAGGKSEEVMGHALKKLGWRRSSYLVSTKIYFGIVNNVNEKNTLNRKRLIEGINGSLKRLDLEYVDLLYCHRSDPTTPIGETVWAMHNIIEWGKALYWGTSEWSAAEIVTAIEFAERHNLHKPVVEQPQYNIFWRDRVEKEYARLFKDYGYGATIFSPLGAGLLTGKHDFRAFTTLKTRTKSTERTLYALELQNQGPWLELVFEGDGFLHNMARILTGTLLEVGAGRLSAEAVTGILEAKERSAAGPLAPPQGLCLLEVLF